MRRWIIAALLLGGAGVALVEGGASDALIRADVVAVAALVALFAVRRLGPPAAARRRVRPPEPDLPPRLEQLERKIVVSVGSALDVHAGLRPILREIAAERLARRGIDLDRDPDAPALLGDGLWDVVRPDRPEPDRLDPHGLPYRELARHLDRLEAL